MGELAGERHGDLTREGDTLGAVLGPHVGQLDAEELGSLPLNVLDADDDLVVHIVHTHDFVVEHKWRIEEFPSVKMVGGMVEPPGGTVNHSGWQAAQISQDRRKACTGHIAADPGRRIPDPRKT